MQKFVIKFVKCKSLHFQEKVSDIVGWEILSNNAKVEWSVASSQCTRVSCELISSKKS